MIDIPGAVEVALMDPEHPDAGVAAHYGDPMREQRTLATEAGLVDRSHRSVLTVSGEERLIWLHSMTTQHLTNLAPMTGTELLVLSPSGRIERHAGVLDDGRATWLDGEPGTAGSTLAYLASMVFRARVQLADRTGDFALVSVVGPAASDVLAALGADELPEPDVLPTPAPRFEAGMVPARPSSVYGAAALPAFGALVRTVPVGADLLVPRPALMEVVAAAGVPLAGIWAYEALRVQALRPRLGFETDDRALPSEAGWNAALHCDKGCYRGREAVAKVHHFGKPPRRVVLLHLDGLASQTLPRRHAAVTTDRGDVVGMIGTSARHHELGPIASALVRHDVEVGMELRVEGIAAAMDPDADQCGACHLANDS